MNMMIDVETLSTKNNAVVISVGVVVFDTDITSTFGAVISDPDVQADYGAHVQPSTALWWMKQSEEARHQFKQSGIATVDILNQISFLYTTMKCTTVWSYGSSFDICVMENLYKLFGIQVPWTYKNVRCCRTLVSLFPHMQREDPEVRHNALDDAIAQAKTCMRVFKSIS